MATKLYTHPVFLEHMTPPGHPERPDRLRAIAKVLEEDTFDELVRVDAPEADEATVLYAHPERHVDKIRAAIPEEGIFAIDADTSVSPKSWEAAIRAVGAANAAVDDVFTGEADNVFVASRPPGHHAEKTTAMGFCLFNNAAIAARYAQKKYGAERVAIVDWDVHHGNGTQDIFWDDPSVLYCSTHQMPLYPGTGGKDETGAGNIVNAPLSPRTGSDLFREAFRSRVLPAIDSFRPDLLIISAGFDAHHRDPLAEIYLTEEDFDWATGQLMDRAAKNSGNRLVSLLEGGYDLEGLSKSVGAHVRRMMRDEMSEELNADIKTMSFEQALDALEKIVDDLERGDVPLDQSIRIYERGEALKSHCDRLLRAAEDKVEKIRLSREGKPVGVEPLDGD